MIDGPTAIELLTRAVNLRGEDYVYWNPLDGERPAADSEEYANGSSCEYWHATTNEPGCIVGLALHLYGVPIRHLILAKQLRIDQLTWRTNLIPSLTDEALDIFSRAQDQQDGGSSWGVALRAAMAPGRTADIPETT